MASKNRQSGFITMIVIIVLVLVAVIGFAFMRVSAINR